MAHNQSDQLWPGRSRNDNHQHHLRDILSRGQSHHDTRTLTSSATTLPWNHSGLPTVFDLQHQIMMTSPGLAHQPLASTDEHQQEANRSQTEQKITPNGTKVHRHSAGSILSRYDMMHRVHDYPGEHRVWHLHSIHQMPQLVVRDQ